MNESNIWGVKVYYKEGTKLWVLFSDYKTKEFDMEVLIKKFPQCSKLRDREFFIHGKNERFGISWNDDIDIDISWIYDEGKLVKNNDPDKIKLCVAANIKRIRYNNPALSQKEFSKLTGIDQGDISKLENGKLNPTIKQLERISKALGKELIINFK